MLYTYLTVESGLPCEHDDDNADNDNVEVRDRECCIPTVFDC